MTWTKNAMFGIPLEKSTLKVSTSIFYPAATVSKSFLAVDQMPLTLHRHYALMQELDQQAHSEYFSILFDVTISSRVRLYRATASYSSRIHL